MTVKIAHIADVHWRGLSRHQEYRETFELFFKQCRNRAGKSSIPGTLTYGLFNKNDRGIVSNLHVVNARADYCQAAVTFSVNDQLYRSERQSVKCM